MKANELMIGDWVKIGNMIAQITRLKKVYNEQQFFSVYYYHTEDKAEEGCFIDEIEPIPLTTEILEKNGFEHHLIAENGFRREEWTLSDDYYDIVVSEWSDSIWVFRYECTEMNTPHEQRTFSYIHNLQHALRDNGIDKEIVL